MKRGSKILIALSAICALGAVPTASASAAEAHWYVGGDETGRKYADRHHSNRGPGPANCQ
jgi:hypothetical protein